MNTHYLDLRLVLVFLMFLAPLRSSAQQPDPLAEDATVTLTPDTGGMVNGLFFILLPDTNNLEALMIQLGSSEGDSNLVNHTFTYDLTSGLPPGYSWNRIGLRVYINVGSFLLTDLRFGKVRLRRVGQSWGNEYAFVSN